MNNTLRYVCKNGRQNYRSFQHHGFRYAWLSVWLSVRSDEPVKIRLPREGTARVNGEMVSS